jgi:hypothetical protein
MAVEHVDKLNSELLSDKKTVTDLQAKLIEKRDEEHVLLKSAVEKEVQSVQGVVETELKSYSSVLTKTCTAALAPNKLHAAVKSFANKEDRSRNVMIYGLDEDSGEDLQDKVSQVLTENRGKTSDQRLLPFLGIKKENGKRPIKFTVQSEKWSIRY